MKFEVGKEYVCERGELRIRVVAANDWGAAFEHIEGIATGRFGCCSHGLSGWRPAPRTVERWIVLWGTGKYRVYDTADSASEGATDGGVVSGPFLCVAP